jgi:hypothetical protein
MTPRIGTTPFLAALLASAIESRWRGLVGRMEALLTLTTWLAQIVGLVVVWRRGGDDNLLGSSGKLRTMTTALIANEPMTWERRRRSALW